MLLRIFSFLIFICFYVPMSWFRNWFGFSRFSQKSHHRISAWDINMEAIAHEGIAQKLDH